MADEGEGKKDPEPAVYDEGDIASKPQPGQTSLEDIKYVEGVAAGGKTIIIERGQSHLNQFDCEIVEADVFTVVIQKNKFKALFDMIPEAGIIHDGKRILNVNKSFEKMSGYKKEEVIDKVLSRVIKENKLVKKDGSISEILMEQSSSEENYLILLSDVGSLRDMEKCYALFNILSDHIRDAVIHANMKGEVLYANNAAGELFGISIVEFESKNLRDLFKRGSKLSSLMKKVMSGEIIETEIECDRGRRSFLANVLLHSINNGKEVLCIVRDISKEKLLENQVEKAREEHDQLVNYVNDIIFSTDHQGSISYVNYQFEKQLGYKAGEIKSMISIIHPEDLQRVISFLSESRKGFKDLEFRVQNSKKKWIYFSMNAVPIKEGSKIVGFRGTLRDISEKKKVENKTEQRRKELEEQNKKLRGQEELKSKLVSSVSHDLRTPLTSIQGYSELLSSKVLGELNKEQEEASNVIHSEAKRLSKLINDLLDVSRMEAGVLVLNKKHFLLSILEDRCSCRPLAQNKGITIMWNTPDSIGEVYADPDRVAQVLTNLVSNSIKFTERGSVTVNAFNKNKKFVQVDVIDTGIGIPKKEKDKIFDRFYQTEKKNKKEGTGLGLSIAKDIVELHGGIIEVDDSIGKGAKISFTLPKYFEGQELKLNEIIEDSLQNTEELNKQEMVQSVQSAMEAINKNENKSVP